MAKKNVADVLVDTLVARGVERIYGVAGDSLNGITDSIRRHAHMRWTHVRHEETAAFAAGAEAHLTGRLAVCAGSCGPGNLHLINGLYDCHRSRVPVLAIAAQIPSAEIGSGYFQETRPEHLFAQCSHYCELVSQPEQMPRVLEIAIQTPPYGFALFYLRSIAPGRQPFFLVVSLVNPHDVLAYPRIWQDGGYDSGTNGRELRG